MGLTPRAPRPSSASDARDPEVLLKSADYLGALALESGQSVVLPSKTAWRLAEVLLGAAELVLEHDFDRERLIGELLQRKGVQATLEHREAARKIAEEYTAL